MKSKTLKVHFTNTFGLRLLCLLKYQVPFELIEIFSLLVTVVFCKNLFYSNDKVDIEILSSVSLCCITGTNIGLEISIFVYVQWLLVEFIQMYYGLLHGFTNFCLLYFGGTVEEFLQIYFTL